MTCLKSYHLWCVGVDGSWENTTECPSSRVAVLAKVEPRQSLERLAPSTFPYQPVPSSWFERKKFASTLGKAKTDATEPLSRNLPIMGPGLEAATWNPERPANCPTSLGGTNRLSLSSSVAGREGLHRVGRGHRCSGPPGWAVPVPPLRGRSSSGLMG